MSVITETQGWHAQIHRGCIMHCTSYTEEDVTMVLATILENWSMGTDEVRRVTLTKKTRPTIIPKPIHTEQGRLINVFNGETVNTE
jgi:hypothetical protein